METLDLERHQRAKNLILSHHFLLNSFQSTYFFTIYFCSSILFDFIGECLIRPIHVVILSSQVIQLSQDETFQIKYLFGVR